jgi:glutamyl-tRNA reductase
VVGLSYKKADAEMRGKFSLNDEAKNNLLEQAKEEGIESLIVISTCNRTEIYGFAQHPFELIKLLCDNSNGTVDDFRQVAYVHKNSDAVRHLFKVGTGLDSQILGDFEIISQIKFFFINKKENALALNYP